MDAKTTNESTLGFLNKVAQSLIPRDCAVAAVIVCAVKPWQISPSSSDAQGDNLDGRKMTPKSISESLTDDSLQKQSPQAIPGQSD